MELLTLKDAAERAGCSTKTLRNRIKTGELRALMKDGKHGPTYFVPETELVRMLAMEAPGGRTVKAAPSNPAPSTVAEAEGTGSSTVPSGVEERVPTVAPGFNNDLVLRLTDKLEEQAMALGKYMAITERAESLESRERQLQEERDRLALELAQAKAELDFLRRDELRKGKRWFGTRRSTKAEKGSSTVADQAAGVS